MGKKPSNNKNIRVTVNDIMVHVSTVLESMKKGTLYNNKTYFEFKLTIYSCQKYKAYAKRYPMLSNKQITFE